MRNTIRNYLATTVFLLVVILFLPIQANATTNGHTADDAINWVKSKNGQALDWDGAYGAQCVDFIAYYYQYLTGTGKIGDAKDFLTNSLPSGWQRLSGVTPQKGDILVWPAANQHVAIYESPTSSWHQNFNQKMYVHQETYSMSGKYACVIRPDFVTDTQAPTISNVKVKEYYDGSYAVYCTVTDNVGVTRVAFPTWTEPNGQDDIVWHEGYESSSEPNQYFFIVNVSKHNSEWNCWYFTHIYAYDAAGNQSSVAAPNVYMDNQPPKVSNISVANKSSSGFRASCTVTDNYEVSTVVFCWLLYDLNGNFIKRGSFIPSQNGNTYYLDINASDYGIDNGFYWKGEVVASDSKKNRGFAFDAWYEWIEQECKHSSKIKTVSSKYLKSAATCEKAAVYYYECGNCHEKLSSTYSYGKALGHKETTVKTPATLNKDGSIVKSCSRCKKVVSRTKIPRAYVYYYEEEVYTGKAIKPVFVMDEYDRDISSSNYSISYKNNTKVGKATFTITFKNNYSGSKTYSFKIVPKETKIVSVKATTKACNVIWKKVSTDFTGYQIQYATSSSFNSGAKTVTVASKTATSKTISNLKSGKNYYVRIRVYKTVAGKNYYSDWSEEKKVKVK